MFHGCSSLKELNLPNLNTKDEINMSYMLYGCSDELQNKIKKQIKKSI
jgi:surface protein